MPYTDEKAQRAGVCPIMVSPHGYNFRACGKPIKRTVTFSDGQTIKVCGLHAAAEDRKKRNRERWDLEFQAREAQNEQDRQNDARLKELGVRYWDKAEVIRVLEAIKQGGLPT